MTTSQLQSLCGLLEPRSIAVIGASQNPKRISGVPLANLLAGFTGQIYAVNPRRTEVQGVRSYASLSEVPGHVDCAIIVVAADKTVDAIKQCATKGVKAAVLLNAGFAELGEEGVQLQQQVADIAATAGMRVVGPNTTGLIDYKNDLHLTFASRAPAQSLARVAVVSQSGGFCGYMERICEMRRMPVAFSVATGNECDLECSDFISALSERVDIDIILLYLEGVRNWEAFRESLKLASQRNKRVIAIKSGSSSIGAKAALVHTAAVAGIDSEYDDVFKQNAVHRAYSVEEMVDVAKAIATGFLPRGNRTAIVTLSGALGVHLADLACASGLRLCEVAEPIQAVIKRLAPLGAARNPIDITAQAINDPTMLERGLDALLTTDSYDIVIIGAGGSVGNPAVAEQLASGLLKIRTRFPEIVLCLTAWVSEEILHPFGEAGLYTSQDAARAIRSLRGALVLAGHSA